MDPSTKNYYLSHIKDSTELYNTLKSEGVGKYFSSAFSPGSRILEIGSGSGRDLSILLSMGYDAYGIDALKEMADQSTLTYPELQERCAKGEIPGDDRFFGGDFDGILCSAMLMHVPEHELFDTMFTIRNNLKSNGRLLISIPVERPGIDAEGRLADGRLFIIRPQSFYDLLLDRLGFVKVAFYHEKDGLGRDGISWAVMIYRLEDSGSVRSIDKIESIINRDKKTATYKLALFRALADIAIAEFKSVKWYGDGSIGVPVRRIAEKWLYYYWPLLGSNDFIPQINGEKPGKSNQIKFRKNVAQLIDHYRMKGGMNGFYNSKVQNLSSEEEKLYSDCIKDISYTIIKGPVAFAGGSLDDGTIFRYNTEDKTVVVPAGIWKELSLLGHWIRDALILRWGELTSRMSDNEIPASTVIDLLLRIPQEDRDVNASKSIFAKLPDLWCVWSGVNIKGKSDIDHVIPFSLWRNNDLWNLLPAHPSVNNKKRDRLPSRRLLRARRDSIVDYWKIIYGESPVRFVRETEQFSGTKMDINWESILFSTLSDAVEITALQRGVERFDV